MNNYRGFLIVCIYISLLSVSSSSLCRVSSSIENPSVMHTTSTFTFNGTVSFDSFNEGPQGDYETNFGIAAGRTLKGTYHDLMIHKRDYKGGVGTTGSYMYVPATPIPVVTRLTLSWKKEDDAPNYFGLWISALDLGNQLDFYRKGVLQYRRNSVDILRLISSRLLYLGNPTYNRKLWTTENFLFLNVYFVGCQFDEVRFVQNTQPAEFESDSHTIGRFRVMSGTPVLPFRPPLNQGQQRLAGAKVRNQLRNQRQEQQPGRQQPEENIEGHKIVNHPPPVVVEISTGGNQIVEHAQGPDHESLEPHVDSHEGHEIVDHPPPLVEIRTGGNQIVERAQGPDHESLEPHVDFHEGHEIVDHPPPLVEIRTGGNQIERAQDPDHESLEPHVDSHEGHEIVDHPPPVAELHTDPNLNTTPNPPSPQESTIPESQVDTQEGIPPPPKITGSTTKKSEAETTTTQAKVGTGAIVGGTLGACAGAAGLASAAVYALQTVQVTPTSIPGADELEGIMTDGLDREFRADPAQAFA